MKAKYKQVKKQTISYEILIEGGQHDIVNTLAKALKIQSKAQAEGWNVRIIKIMPTIVGDMGVDI